MRLQPITINQIQPLSSMSTQVTRVPNETSIPTLPGTIMMRALTRERPKLLNGSVRAMKWKKRIMTSDPQGLAQLSLKVALTEGIQ